jgi:hypothetical protein
VTKDEAWKLAEHWVAAWNAHDLELIMTHYEDFSSYPVNALGGMFYEYGRIHRLL